LAATPGFVKPRLEPDRRARHGRAMSDRPPVPTREERLAAKLRENLKRRKAQARALAAEGPPALPKAPPKS
jgi:hypothetical protein